MFVPGKYTSPLLDSTKPRPKWNYIGAPAAFKLELACQHVAAAFSNSYGLYLVGSVLQRPNWRDVDIRMIMSDEVFEKEFPDCGAVNESRWEFDPRWLLLTSMLSDYLSQQSGLPVDFQFQPQSHANRIHKGPRNAMGMTFRKD